jgi:hypothetical protein
MNRRGIITLFGGAHGRLRRGPPDNERELYIFFPAPVPGPLASDKIAGASEVALTPSELATPIYAPASRSSAHCARTRRPSCRPRPAAFAAETALGRDELNRYRARVFLLEPGAAR